MLLRVGDSIMLIDTASVVSRLLAYFDHGVWSHEATWIGDGKVHEATTSGVVERKHRGLPLSALPSWVISTPAGTDSRATGGHCRIHARATWQAIQLARGAPSGVVSTAEMRLAHPTFRPERQCVPQRHCAHSRRLVPGSKPGGLPKGAPMRCSTPRALQQRDSLRLPAGSLQLLMEVRGFVAVVWSVRSQRPKGANGTSLPTIT